MSDRFADDAREVYDAAYALLLEKHRGYGPGNIAGAPGGPLMGLAVRLYDKLARLRHMLEQGLDSAADESLRDTLLDIGNYGLIGVMVLEDRWPTPEKIAREKIAQERDVTPPVESFEKKQAWPLDPFRGQGSLGAYIERARESAYALHEVGVEYGFLAPDGTTFFRPTHSDFGDYGEEVWGGEDE